MAANLNQTIEMVCLPRQLVAALALQWLIASGEWGRRQPNGGTCGIDALVGAAWDFAEAFEDESAKRLG